jgi:hypothetical protein
MTSTSSNIEQELFEKELVGASALHTKLKEQGVRVSLNKVKKILQEHEVSSITQE